MTESVRDEPSINWSWIAGIWFAGGLFDASQAVLIMHTEGHPGSWLPLFGTELVSWLPWVLATPVIIRFARRFSLFRRPTVGSAALHLATFVVVSTVMESWSALLQVLFNPWHNKRPPTFVDTWSVSLAYQILTFVIVYALIVAVTLFMDARDKMTRQHEELSRAQLASLRRQLEPHFMYNTLNAIAGLVRDHSNAAAVNMIVGLSEFLRRASEDSHRTQVALSEEVEYLQRYLDIQKMRLGDRLQASVEISADLLDAQVPNLLLQPLVENAIKHGVAQRAAGGTVRVTGTVEAGKLCLRVYNDSPGVPIAWQATRTGVGLGNLKTRLQILYGSESGLELRQTDAGGIEVLVTLPLKVA
jgi:two-component system, LytTR family, sensor kinase